MAFPGPGQCTVHQIPCLGHPKHQRSAPEAKARPRTSTYIVGILGRHRDGHGDAGNRDTDAHSGPDTATKHAQAASRHTSDRLQHSSAPMPTRAPGQTHKSRHTRAIPSNRRPQRHGRQQNLERGGTGAQSASRRPAPVGLGHRRSHAIRARFSGGSPRCTCPDWGGGAGAGAGADAAAASTSTVNDYSASSAASTIFLTLEILLRAGCAL